MFSSQPQCSLREGQLRRTEVLTGLRRRAAETAGFSMPEILAVLAIIGILAAIAVALFTSQPAKATGAQAKEIARSASTAAQAIAAENGGSYDNVSPAELSREEPSLRITANASEPYVSAAQGNGSEYEIVIKAPDGDEFKIGQKPTGEETRTCENPVTKAACAGAESGSW